MGPKPLEIERLSIVFSCQREMISVFLNKLFRNDAEDILYLRNCPGCGGDHTINYGELKGFVPLAEDINRLMAKEKEAIERKLTAWGASPDNEISGCWWLNGHCFLIKQVGNKYRLEEL